MRLPVALVQHNAPADGQPADVRRIPAVEGELQEQQQAAERLRDPAQQEVQILVIALEAGFRSLSTFNKAFRAAYDSTPTDYRRGQLQGPSTPESGQIAKNR